ncbi:MAG: hypothetical protein Q8O67_32520 [Deltaproteobacteria bacterium]|nr:hypothetical protein [Deltaproteobacteria bacterium]
MADSWKHLDCCGSPGLSTVKTLTDKSHDSETLCRCRCGAWWFHRFHEIVRFDDGDDITVWWTRLGDAHAQAILATSPVDLGFLAGLDSIRIDHRGMQRVVGQPTESWS